ncbi:MAG: hypothetical protein SV775_16375 [Thermodesulfobacteriota bacterium]|nr:hypothetical protein [Thermodesulfobacteriota bacterium]
MAAFYYVPLGVDGGLYSYPALSLSRDGDPGESLITIEELQGIRGVKVSYGFDLSRTVRVVPMSMWFRIFGADIWSVRIFGLTEMLLLLVISFVMFHRISGNSRVAMLCWLIYLTDSVVLFLGSTELRPDIMVTILTLIVFFCINADDKFYGKREYFIVTLSAVLSAFLLPLTHITAAVSLALLVSYILAEFLLSWKAISVYRKWLGASIITTGAITFLMRREFFALFVPSCYIDRLPFSPAVDVEGGIRDLVSAGVWPIVQKEFTRWADYFLPYNTAVFLAVLLAFSLFGLGILDPRHIRRRPQQLSILVGCAAACIVLALDPKPWSFHALPVVPFFIILLANQLNLTDNLRLKNIAVFLLFALIVLSAGTKLALGGRIVIKSAQNGYSNTEFIDLMTRILDDKDKDYLIVGSTGVWPYIHPTTNVVIFDAKPARMPELKKYLSEIDCILVDNDYKAYNWVSCFETMYPEVYLKRMESIGKEESGWLIRRFFSVEGN